MKRWVGIICVCILSFWVIRPLFGSSYFPMHDDTQVARVVTMGRALQQGQFPVRWVSDLGYGYGYPIFNFYAPLPYYVGGGLYAIGIQNVIATKIMFGIGALLSAVFCYLFLESLFGFAAGIAGTMLFTYAPYHAVQIYIRGSVGEYWAIAFVPLCLWGISLIWQKHYRAKGIFIGSLGLSGVILSHTILGFISVISLVAGCLVFWIAFFTRVSKKSTSLYAFPMLISLGLGISAFYWLPAFSEMRATAVASMISGAPTNFFDHFLCFSQLWNSGWGYGGSAPGCINDGMSFKLGKVQILLAVIGIIGWFVQLKKRTIQKTWYVMAVTVPLLILYVLGVLYISKPVWSLMPFVSFIQYPWRLMAFIMLAVAVCGAYLITIFRSTYLQYGIAAVIVVSCLVVNAKLFRPQYSYQRDFSAFETSEELKYTVSKISDEYLPPGLVKPQTPREATRPLLLSTANVTASLTRQNDTYIQAEVISKSTENVTIQKAYFPGWIYLLNGKQVTPKIVLGLPSMVVSEGKSIIEMKFVNTPVRNWGNVLSLISLSLLGGILYYGKKIDA